MSTDWLTKTHENVNGLDELNFEQISAIKNDFHTMHRKHAALWLLYIHRLAPV